MLNSSVLVQKQYPVSNTPDIISSAMQALHNIHTLDGSITRGMRGITRAFKWADSLLAFSFRCFHVTDVGCWRWGFTAKRMCRKRTKGTTFIVSHVSAHADLDGSPAHFISVVGLIAATVFLLHWKEKHYWAGCWFSSSCLMGCTSVKGLTHSDYFVAITHRLRADWNIGDHWGLFIKSRRPQEKICCCAIKLRSEVLQAGQRMRPAPFKASWDLCPIQAFTRITG